ncbi:MAG: alginate export family protein [Candidatus Omnitrophica bacterium]|nr:alginate export family protein [Candidatus Omnitrophota bacterium]
MGKKLLIALVVIGIALTGTVFAAVENIKVSGDFSAYAVGRSNFHLGSSTAGLFGAIDDDDISVLASVARLRFDADLTEEVSAAVVLVDERVWGTQADDIYAEEAYITLKDVLDSPLTIKVGKQPVKLGLGLILGDFDGDTTNGNYGSWTANTGSAFYAGRIADLSPRKNPEALIASIDLSPIVLTAGYVKLLESTVHQDDDTNIYFANLAYMVEENAAGELYYIASDTQDSPTKGTSKSNVQTIGLRGAAAPIDNLIILAEGAFQSQKKAFDVSAPSTSGKANGDATSAWAGVVAAQYSFLDIEWAPTVMVDFSVVSPKWDPLYTGQNSTSIATALFPAANARAMGITVTAQPREDLGIKLRYCYADLLRDLENVSVGAGSGYYPTYYSTLAMTGQTKFFEEVDLLATYDYTEDVQIGLELDWFMPGDAFADANDEKAFQAVGSMKVSF